MGRGWTCLEDEEGGGGIILFIDPNLGASVINYVFIQVWTMVGVYIAVAIGAVLVVSFFVDQIPKSLFTKSSDLKGDIVDLVLSTGNPLPPVR